MVNTAADLVLKNGQVITVNQQEEVCSAIALKGKQILCVGSNEEVEACVGAKTRVIDLAGRSLVPGFIDAHAHFFLLGAQQADVLDVNCAEFTSIEQIKEKVRQVAEKTPKGEWIRGCCYNETKLKDGRHITRWDLDEVAPDHPVALVRFCFHVSVVNSKALSLMGIPDDAPDEPGGEFLRQDGVINGVLRENSHFSRAKYFDYTNQEMERAVAQADQFLPKIGITSVHEAGGTDAAKLMHVLMDLDRRHALKTRIYMFPFGLSSNQKLFRDFIPTGVHTGFGSEFLRIGAAKIMLDGSSLTPSCSVRESYSHTEGKGVLSMNQQELDEFVESAHCAGFQCTAHAIGDNAIDMLVTAIERAQQKHPRTDARHRIEHCAMVDKDLLHRMKALDIIPIPEPMVIYEHGEDYLRFYGEKRVSMMVALRSMLDSGLQPALSTDFPCYDIIHPMYNMYAACTRKTKRGKDISTEQVVSTMEALKMHTIYAARAAFMDDIIGSLESGKLADMVVLSKPILDISPENFREVEIDLTISNGEIVYER